VSHPCKRFHHGRWECTNVLDDRKKVMNLIFITLLMCDHNHDNNEKLVFPLFLSLLIRVSSVFWAYPSSFFLHGVPKLTSFRHASDRHSGHHFNLGHFPSSFPTPDDASILACIPVTNPFTTLSWPLRSSSHFQSFRCKAISWTTILFPKYYKQYVIPVPSDC